MQNVLIFLLLLASGSANAAHWQQFAQKADETDYLDLESVTRKGSKTQAWTKTVLSKPTPFGVDLPSFAEVKTFIEVDCSAREFRVLTATFFARDGTRLTTVDGELRGRPVTPETFEDALVKKICAAKPRTFAVDLAEKNMPYKCTNSSGKVGSGTGRPSQQGEYSPFLKTSVKAGEFVIFKYANRGKEYWFKSANCAKP